MADATVGPDERLAAAHRAMRAQGDIQLDMAKAPDAPPPPQWLQSFFDWLGRAMEPVGRFFRWIDGFLPDIPFARILFWSVLGGLTLVFLWMAVQRFRTGEWRLPRLRRRPAVLPAEDEAQEDWRPDAAPARAWLNEADALAAQGRFAEAAHHLLLRSVEDLANRRPRVVRPALTSRDLAHATGIPQVPRQIFAQIAAVVERSLFGGRAVMEDEWAACRAAYADFAQPRSWRG